MVTAQRELPIQTNKVQWYSECYEEAMTSFTDQPIREKGLTRDDHVHGALLILNELLRCSNSQWEKQYTALMQKLDADQDTSDEIMSLNAKITTSWNQQQFCEEKLQPASIFESAICKKLITEKYEKICSGKWRLTIIKIMK